MAQLNGLALEYQGEYGTACRYIDITDVRDYPPGSRVGRVFGPGFFEQIQGLSVVKIGPFNQGTGDSFFDRREFRLAFLERSFALSARRVCNRIRRHGT